MVKIQSLTYRMAPITQRNLHPPRHAPAMLPRQRRVLDAVTEAMHLGFGADLAGMLGGPLGDRESDRDAVGPDGNLDSGGTD